MARRTGRKMPINLFPDLQLARTKNILRGFSLKAFSVRKHKWPLDSVDS